jgi:hypothetical protein
MMMMLRLDDDEDNNDHSNLTSNSDSASMDGMLLVGYVECAPPQPRNQHIDIIGQVCTCLCMCVCLSVRLTCNPRAQYIYVCDPIPLLSPVSEFF